MITERYGASSRTLMIQGESFRLRQKKAGVLGRAHRNDG
jgi:hypothetical protein